MIQQNKTKTPTHTSARRPTCAPRGTSRARPRGARPSGATPPGTPPRAPLRGSRRRAPPSMRRQARASPSRRPSCAPSPASTRSAACSCRRRSAPRSGPARRVSARPSAARRRAAPSPTARGTRRRPVKRAPPRVRMPDPRCGRPTRATLVCARRSSLATSRCGWVLAHDECSGDDATRVPHREQSGFED